MFVFALILLFFANHQSPAVLFDIAGAETATNGNGLPAFALGHVHGPVRRLRLRHRRDVRRGDGRCESPGPARRPVVDLVSGIVGAVFLLAIILAIPGIPTPWPRDRRAASRSRPRSGAL